MALFFFIRLHFSPLLHSPSPCTQLTEFFDDQKNLGEEHISAGKQLSNVHIESGFVIASLDANHDDTR